MPSPEATAARRAGDPHLLAAREGRWRWPWALAGTALTVALVLAAQILVVGLLESMARRRGVSIAGEVKLDPAKPLTFLDLLLAFLPMLAIPPLVLAGFHRLGWGRVLPASLGRFARDWLRGAGACLVAIGAAMLIVWLWEPQQFRLVPRGASWLPWLALGMLVILVQSLSEEVLFKSYLTRVWGAVAPYRLPVGIVMLALFASLHIPNEDVATDPWFNLLGLAGGAAVSWALFFRTGSIAGPAGWHFMNNSLAFFGVATEPGQSQEMALLVYRDPVIAAGGTNLARPFAWVVLGLQLALLTWLLFARRSPLRVEPLEIGPEPALPPQPAPGPQMPRQPTPAPETPPATGPQPPGSGGQQVS
jgi:membrane protease YdiL (CAAX protease family)